MQVLVPHMSCICNNSAEEIAAVASGYKEIYTTSSAGIFKRHVFRGEGRFVRLKVDSIPGYTEGAPQQQEICFLPSGKIPHVIWDQILAFFKKIMEVKKSEVEAMIHVLYNPERGYHIGVPPQIVSKASASYDWGYIPDGTSIILDCHSHNTMGRYYS